MTHVLVILARVRIKGSKRIEIHTIMVYGNTAKECMLVCCRVSQSRMVCGAHKLRIVGRSIRAHG